MTEHEDSLFRRFFPANPRKFGDEPDYRFTMANERTFLAWIRTALALAAGGLGSISLLADEFAGAEAVGILLLALSFLTAGAAYRRWARAETSMRLGRPLPPSSLPILMAIGTSVVALAAAVFFIID